MKECLIEFGLPLLAWLLGCIVLVWITKYFR